MRHRKHTFKIGKSSAHRKAMLANLASSLFVEGRIHTTVTKAKEARRLAERMITLGKRGSLHARRQAISILGQPDVVHYLFAEIAPRYEGRHGGYTRIMRLGRRRGDSAEMCLLELVTEPLVAAVSEPVEETAEPEPVAEGEGEEAANADEKS